MEIIIGREEGARRLHCIVDGREFNIGKAGIVPPSVSRNHCKLNINGDSITIINIKEENITYVDDNQIFVKRITPMSKVQLGREKFILPLQHILQLAEGRQEEDNAPKESRSFSLRPLEQIWEEYSTKMIQIDLDMAKKQKAEKKKRGIQALCSSAGLLFVLIPQLGYVRFVLVFISVCITAYLLLASDDDDISSVKRKNLNDEYSLKYKCPNPECGRPFGYRSYKEIEYNRQCFACGCRYTH